MSDEQTTDDRPARAASFGHVATTYAVARPSYPVEAARFLTEASPCDVLELGAGTGKLTQHLVALDHDVLAVDPSVDMLKQLRKAAPGARTAVGVAESIALPTSSVDVVVAAQSFHWFDRDAALREVARVLRPGGVLSLVWNVPDYKVPWVRRLFALWGQGPQDNDDPVEESEVFDLDRTQEFRHWQLLHRDSVQRLVSTMSQVSTLPAEDRDELLQKAGAIYDDYGRGPDGMLLPWHTTCFRARVSVDHTSSQPPRRRQSPPTADDDALLIDFL